MPINFDLESLRKEHECVNYFETGLYDPRCGVSIRNALSCGFEKVFCIELREDWVELGNEVLKDYINTNRLKLYLDDSANMKKYVNDDNFKNKTIFFLDAHIDGAFTSHQSNYKFRCPLFEELEAIKSIQRNDNIILIDDLRIIRTLFPWGEGSYGNIDFIEKIKSIILTINKDYKFGTLNGEIEDDVLIAYIPLNKLHIE
jgi:hypothetical protein